MKSEAKPLLLNHGKGVFQSKEGPTKAFCTVCTVYFGIGHGGRSDVKRHVENTSHSAKVGLR